MYVAPGNAGTAREPKLHNLPLSAHADLMDFCRREGIAFTVGGPEAPLAAGIVDVLDADGYLFGTPANFGSICTEEPLDPVVGWVGL